MCKFLRSGLMALVAAASAYAQVPVAADKVHLLDSLFSAPAQHNGLSCTAKPYHPFLDFAFRFEGGYVLTCPIKQFQGKENSLLTFVRITPAGKGAPLTLADRSTIPKLPPALQQEINWKHLSAEAELSGVFTMGEGEYRIDLVSIDEQMRSFRKSWTTKAFAHGHEKHAIIAIPPNTASSALILPQRAAGNPAIGPSTRRLTVLLDAAPMQPFSRKLRAWDRAFLLQSLASLLRDTPYSSVRLIAFNLDQRQEIFRQENFKHSDFLNLAGALSRLELGAVSYHVLQDQQGWSRLLAKLVNDEQTAQNPSDAVIFLGPRIRIDEKIPREMLKLEGTNPRLFYFEFFPAFSGDFPDAIHHLTTACKGTVLKLHSPAELAEGIQKMQRILSDSAVRDSVSSLHRPLSSERTPDRQTAAHLPSIFSVPEAFSKPSP